MAGVLLGGCGSPSAPGDDPGPAPELVPVDDPGPEPAPESGDSLHEARRPADDFRTATSRAGKYTIQWRPVGGEVPKNAHF